MIHNDEIFDLLIAEGSISPALGSIVKDPSNHLGAIAGIAILASVKAKEDAAKLPIARMLVKNNSLYKVSPDGSETFIKTLPTYSKPVPKRFKLA